MQEADTLRGAEADDPGLAVLESVPRLDDWQSAPREIAPVSVLLPPVQRGVKLPASIHGRVAEVAEGAQ